jgi:cellulose synthase operon protein C
MLRLCGVLVCVCTIGAATACKTAPADRVKRGDEYAAKKQIAEAIVEYRSALQQDAKLGEARLKLADLYAEQGDGQNAYREYIRAADTLPAHRDAQLKAGAMLLLANRFAEAKARAENVLRIAPHDSGALMLLGNALAGLNDVNGAFRRLNEAIEADPGSAIAYANLGTLQLARGDRRMAEASFKKAINANPNVASARVALANYYRAQNRDQDAENTLNEAARVEPRNVQVNSNLVELYIRSGRPQLAEGPLKEIVNVMNNADAQFALAEYYLRMKRFDDAEPILRKLAEAKETSALARARLAAVDYKQGRAAEAHHKIDEILQAEPNNRAALLLKGQLLSSEKKLDEALRYLQAAAAADPAREDEPNLIAARIYVAKGQLEDAQDTYKKTLTRNPGSIGAQIGLSQLYAARGEFKNAAELARGAVTHDPRNGEARLTLVRVLQAAPMALRENSAFSRTVCHRQRRSKFNWGRSFSHETTRRQPRPPSPGRWRLALARRRPWPASSVSISPPRIASWPCRGSRRASRKRRTTNTRGTSPLTCTSV